MSKALDFKDKVVLITGGSTGIGKTTALKFAEHGATVVIGDITDEAKHTIEMIKENGGKGKFIRVDVSKAEEVEAFISDAVNTYGCIDCAFNNAGILPPTQPLLEVDEETFDKVINVDLKGVFLSMKYQIKAMLKTGGGSIVNTASVAGVIADPGMSAYVAAKHGVVGLTKAAALDYAEQGIRVNALAPGLVETPMTQRWLSDPNFHDLLVSGIPMKRAAQPDEMAGMVLFLCSELSTFSTGQVYTVDGGQTAH